MTSGPYLFFYCSVQRVQPEGLRVFVCYCVCVSQWSNNRWGSRSNAPVCSHSAQRSCVRGQRVCWGRWRWWLSLVVTWGYEGCECGGGGGGDGGGGGG